jgi:hypothetical protein
MSLNGFIRAHHEEIISEFARFARTLMPPGPEMTEAELRDHAEEILTAVVQDRATCSCGKGTRTTTSSSSFTERS